MSGWNPSAGSGQDPYGRPDEGSHGADADLTGTQYPPPAGAVPGPPGPRRSRRRRSRARLRAAVSGGAVLVVTIVAVTACGSGPRPGPGVPASTPTGVQLEQLLPTSQALPAGWYLISEPKGSAAYVETGSAPPRPLDQCEDFNLGFDLGVAGDKFLSLASETAQYGAGPGDGSLRADLFAVAPTDAAAAIDAVKPWVARCSTYTTSGTFGGVSIARNYTVTATTVPGLGDQSLDVRVTEQKPPGSLPPTDNNTLLVRVGNDLIAIECLAPPRSLIASLAGLAAPMARKLPTAPRLPKSGPATRPAPVASPNLSFSELNRLLPVTSGLPAQYYQGNPATPIDWPMPGDVPLTEPPTLSCAQLLGLTDGANIYQYYVNYRDVAYLSELDLNSNALDVAIDQVTNEGLAIADVAELKTAATRCPQVSQTLAGSTYTYKTVVTSVPGFADQNVNVYLDPVSASGGADLPGPADVLMVRVGAAFVLVDYNLSLPGPAPSVTSIARPIVDKL